jgi:hypothetical protein
MEEARIDVRDTHNRDLRPVLKVEDRIAAFLSLGGYNLLGTRALGGVAAK